VSFPKYEKFDFWKKVNRNASIYIYLYQNIRISNTITILHYTLMSRNCTTFRNYFSTVYYSETCDSDRWRQTVTAYVSLKKYYLIELVGDRVSSRLYIFGFHCESNGWSAIEYKLEYQINYWERRVSELRRLRNSNINKCNSLKLLKKNSINFISKPMWNFLSKLMWRLLSQWGEGQTVLQSSSRL